MDNVIKVKGITKRWIFNFLGVFLGVVIVIELAFAFFIQGYYYNSVSQNINTRVNMYSSSFGQIGTGDREEYELTAQKFVEDFSEKNLMEIVFYDKYDRAIVSTSGFAVTDTVKKDYYDAKASKNNRSEWIGRNIANEKIMAVTVTNNAGAVRYIVSMMGIDKQISKNIFFAACAGAFIIILTAVSGFFFLNSIIKPVKEITATAYRIASGHFDARLTVRENDEIGKLCDTINYMATELAGAETMKNDFISSVSHELRTPLTVIKGWGETVKLSAKTDPELVEKGMTVIIGESERLSGLVEDLLDFSRLQSGHLTLKMNKIDILADIAEAVYMFKDTAKQKNIIFDYIEPVTMPPVLGDPNRLKQVFINILDNAFKYTETGGHIIVEATQHDIYVQITVKDTGCGIPLQDLAKVKEKFFKANNAIRGSGIGLAIADEIIKNHSGILEIDSKEGVGTSVSIVLPIMQPTSPDIEDTDNERNKTDDE